MIINKLTARLSSRFLMFCVMLTGAFASAAADNEIRLDGASFKPGEQKVIPIEMLNDDPVSSLQMDVRLPDGIELCEGDEIQRNEERLLREEHTLTISKVTGTNLYRIVILTINGNNIQSNEGVIAYLNLKATGRFTRTGNLVFDNILGSGKLADGSLKDVDFHDVSVVLSPNVGAISFVEDTVSVRPEGMLRKVSVALKNDVTACGLSAEFVMPDGVEIEKNSVGSYKFEYSSRLPKNAAISSKVLENGKIRVVVSSIDAQPFIGSDGTLFSFSVKGPAEFPEISKMFVDNAMLSDENANAYVLDSKDSVVFVNAETAYYLPARKLVDSLRNALDSAVAAVDTIAPDVKDSEEVLAARNSIAASIEAMSTALEESYADETLTYVSEETVAEFDRLLAAVRQYVDDAVAAQEKYSAEKANEEAYARLSAALDEVQKMFDAAKDSVNSKFSSVAGQFVGVMDSIQSRITELSDSVRAEYEAVGLTAESTVDTASVKVSIEKLLDDAEKASVASGIAGVQAGGVRVAGVYTVTGRQVSVPSKGQVYLFKYSDGTVRKRYVK